MGGGDYVARTRLALLIGQLVRIALVMPLNLRHAN